MILSTPAMKRIKRSDRPLNPYSRCFFGLWLLAMLSAVGFRQNADGPSYKAQIDEWHRNRVNALRSETGWLNLVGLFWLNEGKNLIGRGDNFDVSFPAANAPADLGSLSVQNGEVRFEPTLGAATSVNGKPVTKPLVVFSPNSPSAVLANGSLRWHIIKRGDKYGIRLRDLESPLLKEFRAIERYPVDETWHINAKLEASGTSRTIPIVNVLGQITQTPLVGTLVFQKAGKIYHLDAISEENKLFILFGDATNTHDTYGAGRFLYAEKPGPDGVTALDFNQAINPPCAFTTFATCPLPPKQNKLTMAVTAGEKRYGNH